AGIRAEAIHGNKSQNNRQKALEGFKNRSIKILVATDIASRGIDVDKLTHVINFELPEVAETYVHRIGRTGRAGEAGTALSFCATEERAYLKDINKLLPQNIEVVNSTSFQGAKKYTESEHVSEAAPVKKNSSEQRAKKSFRKHHFKNRAY